MIYRLIWVALTATLCFSGCGNNSDIGGANEPFALETKAERQFVVNEAFTEKPVMIAPPATVKNIQRMFDRIGTMTKNGTTPAASKFFDYREMTLAVFRVIGTIPKSKLQLKRAVNSMRSESIEADLDPDSYFVRWEETELRRVELSADKDVALVYARHWKDDFGSVSSYRWWLKRSGTGWRIYDWEDIEHGDRSSRGAVGVISYTVDVTPPAWTNKIVEYNLAFEYESKDEYQKALFTWVRLARVNFPPDMKALVRAYAARCALNLDRPDQALDWTDKAIKVRADVPFVYSLRAWAFSDKEDWNAAIKSYRKFCELLADEPVINNEIANCYLQLGETEKALSEYRKSFAVRPNLDGFVGICRTIDTEKADELGPLFKKFKNLETAFEYVMPEIYDEDYMVAESKVVLGSYIENTNPSLLYYQYARNIASDDDRFEDAVKFAALHYNLVGKEEKADSRRYYGYVLYKNKQALEALAMAKNSEKMFSYIALMMMQGEENKELSEILGKWKVDNQDHAKTKFFDAYLLQTNSKFEESTKLYRQAMKHIDSEDEYFSSYRKQAVIGYVAAGMSVEACKEFKPFSETVQEVCLAVLDEKDWETLATVLKDHGAKMDRNVKDAYGVELLYGQENWARAADAAMKWTRNIKKEDRYWRGLELVIYSLVRVHWTNAKSKSDLTAYRWAKTFYEEPNLYMKLIIDLATGTGETGLHEYTEYLKSIEYTEENIKETFVQLYENELIGEYLKRPEFKWFQDAYPIPVSDSETTPGESADDSTENEKTE